MKVYKLQVIIIRWFLKETKKVKNETGFQELQVRYIFANRNAEKNNFL